MPSKKLKKFNWLSGVFARNNVVLGFGVPTLLAMLDEEKSIEVFKGMWTASPINFDFEDYEMMEYFAHPSKISKYKDKIIGNKFCKKFVQEKIQF